MKTYNFSTWVYVKSKFIILILLILDLKQPSNDIDIYLEPLIGDLKLLWNDVTKVYDAFRKNISILR